VLTPSATMLERAVVSVLNQFAISKDCGRD